MREYLAATAVAVPLDNPSGVSQFLSAALARPDPASTLRTWIAYRDDFAAATPGGTGAHSGHFADFVCDDPILLDRRIDR